MIKPPKAANVALRPGRFFLACSGALLVPCGKTNSLGFAVAKIWSVRLYMVFVSSCFLSKDSFIKLSNLASNLWVCVSPGMATKKTSPSCPKTKPPTLLAFDRNFSGATSLERSSANTADSWIKTPQTPQGQSVKVILCYLIWQVFWEQTHFAGHFHNYIQKKIKKKTCDIVWASQLSMTHWWSGPLVIPGTRWRLGNRTRKSHDRNYRFSADHKGPWPQ